jgi:5-methylcytosine-specific restriction endonuclease McrA
MASVKSRRKPSTPRSQVRAALRRLWLRSRERAAALKRDKYTCQDCGVKQSRKKGKEVYVEVHHCEGILNWERLLEHVYRHLLCDPKLLETLCKRCHEKQ